MVEAYQLSVTYELSRFKKQDYLIKRTLRTNMWKIYWKNSKFDLRNLRF